jgi:hypothetical protein
MKANGFNPLRWDCSRQGCYNIHCRPKIEVFADCFPGRINFGDQDAPLVERNCRGLMMEWKPIAQITDGQRLCYENLSRVGFMVGMAVVGDPRTMEVSKYGLFIDGKFQGWRDADLKETKRVVRAWCERAEQLPRVKCHRAAAHERISRNRIDEAWVADYEAHEGEFLPLLDK